jgi:hypothetical protein
MNVFVEDKIGSNRDFNLSLAICLDVTVFAK